MAEGRSLNSLDRIYAVSYVTHTPSPVIAYPCPTADSAQLFVQ
jgi:hypothetical protein